MADDRLAFIWGRQCAAADNAEDMAKYAIFFVHALSDEAKKKYGAKKFLEELKVIYVKSGDTVQSFQKRELKILEWVARASGDLVFTHEDDIDIGGFE